MGNLNKVLLIGRVRTPLVEKTAEGREAWFEMEVTTNHAGTHTVHQLRGSASLYPRHAVDLFRKRRPIYVEGRIEPDRTIQVTHMYILGNPTDPPDAGDSDAPD